MTIAENLDRVRERIHRACERAGRTPDSVRLVAVTKTVPPESIRQAYAAGVREFGENRVQEAAAKRQLLRDLDAVWHLIGHLQSNKVKHASELFSWIHSVDSLHIAQRIDRFAAALGKKMPVLIEVHLGDESSKFGVKVNGLVTLAEQVGALSSLELRGLMAVPPFFENPEEVRPFFRCLRDLAAHIESHNLPGVTMRELSMGMSHDFEIAIEEGATMVRIGTAIFGERQR